MPAEHVIVLDGKRGLWQLEQAAIRICELRAHGQPDLLLEVGVDAGGLAGGTDGFAQLAAAGLGAISSETAQVVMTAAFLGDSEPIPIPLDAREAPVRGVDASVREVRQISAERGGALGIGIHMRDALHLRLYHGCSFFW